MIRPNFLFIDDSRVLFVPAYYSVEGTKYFHERDKSLCVDFSTEVTGVVSPEKHALISHRTCVTVIPTDRLRANKTKCFILYLLSSLSIALVEQSDAQRDSFSFVGACSSEDLDGAYRMVLSGKTDRKRRVVCEVSNESARGN